MSAEPAFLLHRKPYRETSALVDLLTLNNGRIRAVAHGGQRPGSKSRQRLQPFTPLFVSWRGERDLKRLTLMESRGQTALLAGEGLLCGFYANEIATRLLPLELAAPDVFAFYTALLEALPMPSKRALALRRYEWALLDALELPRVFVRQIITCWTRKPAIGLMHKAVLFFPQSRGLKGAHCVILSRVTGNMRG